MSVRNATDVHEMNLFQRLAGVRDVADVVRKNKEGYGYTYASEDEILAQVKAGMSKYHVSIFPSIVPDTDYMEKHNFKKQKYDKATKQMKEEDVVEYTFNARLNMIVVNDDNPEDRMEIPWVCVATSGDTSQAFGSALTYANRYFLLKFFHIATSNDDPDAWRKKNKEAEERENLEAVKEIVELIRQEINKNLHEDNRAGFAEALKGSKLLVENGKATANYTVVRTVEQAEAVLAFVKQYFAEPQPEQKPAKGAKKTVKEET